MDILVIGDKKHRRATCVDWMEEFPNIEEFDLVIIALIVTGFSCFVVSEDLA